MSQYFISSTKRMMTISTKQAIMKKCSHLSISSRWDFKKNDIRHMKTSEKNFHFINHEKEKDFRWTINFN
jgi:hypothetical protein